MSKNSRYYYKRYLEEAKDHIYIAHERLMAASALITDESHMNHISWIQEYDNVLFNAMANLDEYLKTI